MAKSIMIQGTMSGAGKSLIAAAFCRIFSQEGYRTAPFKSQNMALNSFITRDGLEIGRAQAMQAEAAGTEPSVLMNPILLKPTTDIGSQVIVSGEVVGNMSASDYFRRKRELIPEIMRSYHELERLYDVIVIEGAGSPVELNLKEDDIVNMGMAKLVSSPVILVGDIDRGGVFAQILGTLSLLERDESDIVKGVMVNKFRGDRSLFESGVKILEERGKKPVVGVVPYIKCDIDDEDSLSDKLLQKNSGAVDIAVIKLPKISNFTDFDVFSQYSDVLVRYVSKTEELGEPDMIIIPGTKSTISDMKWLRTSGLETAVKKCISRYIPVFGICGGYQMLGKKISDPENTEGGGEIFGMGLLDTMTVFKKNKTRTQTSGRVFVKNGFFSCISGASFEGYEIHMGDTVVGGDTLSRLSEGGRDGSYKGNVAGSYVHGFFDKKEISGSIVRALFRKKGREYGGMSVDRKAYKESQYDILADAVRKSVDTELLFKILREGI